MKEVWGRVRIGWVYLLGIVLMVGFSLLIAHSNSTAKSEPENPPVKAVQKDKDLNASQPEQKTTANQRGSSKSAAKSTENIIPAVKSSSRTAQVNNSSAGAVMAPAQSAPTQPVQTNPAETVEMQISGLGSFTVPITDGENAFDALKEAANENGFRIEYKTYSWGVMITKIGGTEMQGTYYWALYYNGNYSDVGASDLTVKNNDVIKWSYESWM